MRQKDFQFILQVSFSKRGLETWGTEVGLGKEPAQNHPPDVNFIRREGGFLTMGSREWGTESRRGAFMNKGKH